MAKPIRATPTLNQKESEDFMKKMIEVEKRRSNRTEQFFIDAISSNIKNN